MRIIIIFTFCLLVSGLAAEEGTYILVRENSNSKTTAYLISKDKLDIAMCFSTALPASTARNIFQHWRRSYVEEPYPSDPNWERWFKNREIK